jgi:hypothetical protein
LAFLLLLGVIIVYAFAYMKDHVHFFVKGYYCSVNPFAVPASIFFRQYGGAAWHRRRL